MSRALVRSWLWKSKIYVWQFMSCVQFICRWQAITREYSGLQNTKVVQRKTIASWSPDILGIALQKMLTPAVICITSCERSSVKWNWWPYLRASMTKNKSWQIAVPSPRSDCTIQIKFIAQSKLNDVFLYKWNCRFAVCNMLFDFFVRCTTLSVKTMQAFELW